MGKSDILKTVRDILWGGESRMTCDAITVDDISMEANLSNDLGLDSLDRIELTMHLEKEFNLFIPDDKVETMETIGQFVDYIYESISNGVDKQTG